MCFVNLVLHSRFLLFNRKYSHKDVYWLLNFLSNLNLYVLHFSFFKRGLESIWIRTTNLYCTTHGYVTD